MKASILLGVVLTFVGTVLAGPLAATSTTPQKPDPVAIAPRRNGFSDLPSDVNTYNSQNPSNQIPDNIMASPETGATSNSIIYTAAEIYTAMQQGYEVLQRTRDTPPGVGVTYGNIIYPADADFEDLGLANTFYGQFGDDAGDIGDVYMWPLIWTNSYTGFNQNPGYDRVLFNENGIYLGVITRRTSSTSTGGYHWCPSTDGYGRWNAQNIGGTRGWNYPGMPPEGSDSYERPTRWNIATNQRQTWWSINGGSGGMPPVGSVSKNTEVNSSSTSNSSAPWIIELNPLNATIDPSDPLHFPPMDNSTGVWQVYVPSNATNSTLIKEFVPGDCQMASTTGSLSYYQACQSQWTKGSAVLKYRITISGTGQDTSGWCSGVMDNIHGKCGGNGNPQYLYSCNTRYPGTATFTTTTDPTNEYWNKYYFGIDMHFYLDYPWAQSDADHTCIAEAVHAASCAGAGVVAANGEWCRNAFWVPSTPLLEWSTDMGPA